MHTVYKIPAFFFSSSSFLANSTASSCLFFFSCSAFSSFWALYLIPEIKNVQWKMLKETSNLTYKGGWINNWKIEYRDKNGKIKEMKKGWMGNKWMDGKWKNGK